jgi:hypothetical protein
MALRDHYETKYNWTNKTIDSLWWPIYFQSLSKLLNEDKLQIKKFVNNGWPTIRREKNITTKQIHPVIVPNADYTSKTKII